MQLIRRPRPSRGVGWAGKEDLHWVVPLFFSFSSHIYYSDRSNKASALSVGALPAASCSDFDSNSDTAVLGSFLELAVLSSVPTK
jgi:hypothetical protein